MSPTASEPPVGPVDATRVPRFAGHATFARLPRADEVGHAAIRGCSRLLRPYHPGLGLAPFAVQQVVDAGDVAANPFDIGEAVAAVEAAADGFASSGTRLVTLGGDHTIALPLLRAAAKVHGPVALLHFDAHLDTWDTYFGAPYTHGTPFRRASEEGLLQRGAMTHVGIRGPLYGASDLDDDAALGFGIVSTTDVAEQGVRAVVDGVRERLGDAPVYVSVDIDVLDPAHAPGTGTPEAGGLTSRELLGILRGLAGCRLVGADVVEVAPAYDHAEVTAVAAAHVAYELVGLMGTRTDGAA